MAYSKNLSEPNREMIEWTWRELVETARIDGELGDEYERFQRSWKNYELRLEKEVTQSKLPAEWTPQHDLVSGKSYYLNTRTGKTQKEHPNKKLFFQLISQQKVRAMDIYNGNTQRLLQFRDFLERKHSEHRIKIIETVISMLRSF